MADGGFFGGLASGLTNARQQSLQQQQIDQQGSYQSGMLQIEQQRMQHQQQRELYARADKDVSNLMDTASRTIDALKMQGADNATIAKKIQPIVQAAKRLRQSSGGDPSMIDAQVAATLAQPGFDPKSLTGTGTAPQAAQSQGSVPTDIPVPGTGPQPPGQNMSDQNIISVEPVSTEKMDSTGRVISKTTAPQQSDVDRFTMALATLPATAPPNLKEAIKLRLQQAIQQETPEASVHFMKMDDGSEKPLVITKRGANVTITDTNGNKYVPPNGADGEKTSAQEIAGAIMDGKQPPATTGLYKQGAAVKAELARKGFDLTNAQLEWQAAQKQVQSLNGPQMTRYAGLAKSVVNTIDEVKSLSQEMQNSGVPLLNAAKIQAYIQTEGNSKNGQLAARYLAAVNTLKEEFANLAQGGYAPTEAAWTLANQQINGNYGVQQLSASLNEVQRLINYRLQGIPNFSKLGPDAPNRYKPTGSTQPAETPQSGGAVDWQSYFGAGK